MTGGAVVSWLAAVAALGAVGFVVAGFVAAGVGAGAVTTFAEGVVMGAGSGATTVEGVVSGGVTASMDSGGAVWRFTGTGFCTEPAASGREAG
jgi:hypothetical protein